jgi:hypothetical protein
MDRLLSRRINRVEQDHVAGVRGHLSPGTALVVTCVSPAVKALPAEGSGPEAVVKVERPQRSEDERP